MTFRLILHVETTDTTVACLQRLGLAPYGTPHSADTSTVSSPAASSAGPASGGHGYLGGGAGGNGVPSSERKAVVGDAVGVNGGGDGAFGVEYSNGQ